MVSDRGGSSMQKATLNQPIQGSPIHVRIEASLFRAALLSACLIVFVSTDLLAATYYVSPTGSDTNTGLSVTTPWRTFGKAAATAQAGDTVYLRAGMYRELVTLGHSGTSTNRITFASYPGENAIIDGTGGPPPISNFWTQTPIIYISGSYVTVRGLEVANASGNDSIQIYGNFVILDTLHVHHSYGTGMNFYGTNDGQVLNSRVHDVNSGGNADCIKVYGSDGGVSQRHIIRGNVVYNCSDDGVDTWLSTNNTIENNTAYHTGYDSSGNLAGDGNGFKLGTGGNNIVRNNIAVNNSRRGFDDNGGSGNQLWNNIAFGNPLNYREGLILVSSNRTVNPLFVSTDPTSPNFLRLSAGSPAIDAGVDVGLPYSGSAPDLGAYEYGGPSDTTPPPVPSGLRVQ